MPSNVGVALPVGNWPQINNVADSLNLNRLGLPPSLALKEQGINRYQQLANILMQRGLTPAQGQMAGRFYVPPTWAQGAAQLGSAAAGVGLNIAGEYQRQDIADESQNILSASLQKYRDSIAPQEVQTKAADTRSVNGSGVEPGLPYGIDPHTMPSQGWDINTYQPDTTQQVQDNKNAIALNTPQPQEQEQPLQGVPQQMNPWTTELIGQPNQPPAQAQLVDALQQRYDQGEQYTRQPFQQPQSQVTVSGAESAMQERTPQQKQQALVELMASQHPQAQAIAQALMKQEEAHAEKVSQREFLHSEKEADRTFQAEQKGLDRDSRLAESMNKIDTMVMLGLMKKEDAAAAKAQAAEQFKMHDQTLKEIAKINAAAKTDSAHIKADAAQDKPMPPRIMTQIQENLDAIGIQSAIESDLKALENQIDSGKLKLGMVENAIGSTKNFLGLSDENSRNQASLKATVEKMRNDSLRVNKGVQTEGDAIRAFNELLSNLNDPQMVKQRFSEIRAINRRGVELQKRNVDMLRQEYGKEPMDFTGYENQPAAVGQGGGGGLSKEEHARDTVEPGERSIWSHPSTD
jgi:hypothetical protein